MYYVVGCTHLDDPGILPYRGYRTVAEMNEHIVHRWNAVVTEDDLIYVLGDFAAYRVDYWTNALKGTKVLVIGNHDPRSIYSAGFSEVLMSTNLILPPAADGEAPREFWLSHYPSQAWPGKGGGRDVWHLHAHSHGKLGRLVPGITGPTRVDVSMDAWPETWPLQLETIRNVKNGY